MASELSPHTVLCTWRWPSQALAVLTWNSETQPVHPYSRGTLLPVPLGPHPVIRGFGQLGLRLNFPASCRSPAPVKSRATAVASKPPLPAERGLTLHSCTCGSSGDPKALGWGLTLLPPG